MSDAFPIVDGRTQAALTPDQAEAFVRTGALIVRNLIAPDELRALQEQTEILVRVAADGIAHPDFAYQMHPETGTRTPYRVEYVIDKTNAGRALLAHPFVLRTVETIQGPDFFPTWDAMVYKSPGAGAAVPWHRDGGIVHDAYLRQEVCPVFNVDFYLDAADRTNCVWAIPGSNLWGPDEAKAAMARLNDGGFRTDPSCVPVEMQPGDVLFHNILLLHGSAPAQSHLRRVVYYEFRPHALESAYGPHTPPYFSEKLRVLDACMAHRAATPYAADETPFRYRGTKIPRLPYHPGATLPTYRFRHADYWRA